MQSEMEPKCSHQNAMVSKASGDYVQSIQDSFVNQYGAIAGVCMSSIVWFTTSRSASSRQNTRQTTVIQMLTNIVSEIESGEHFDSFVCLDLADDFHI